MSRHRNVRQLKYNDDYEDDYMSGHSLEEDLALSPTSAQFMYRRGEQGQTSLFSLMKKQSEQPAAASEAESKPQASATGNLESDLAQIKAVLGKGIDEGHTRLQHDDNVQQAVDRRKAVDEASSNKGGKDLSRTPIVTVASSNQKQSSFRVPTSLSVPSSRDTSRSPSPAVGTSRKTSPHASPSRSRREMGTPDRVASPEREEGSATRRPTYGRKLSKQYSRSQSLDILSELEKRKAGKESINLVVIGHVDAGKSTLMGHVLYLLGSVNQRAMHKYENESRKAGKASFAYAWVLDETGEERSRGITMDVAMTKFETSKKVVTLLDAPGHKDFIPHMITGAAQADVAVMVIDAARGEFEAGFDAGGQTREHAMLVRSLGVKQLAVAVNKMDTIDWEEARFREIVKKLTLFLKQAGFKETNITFVPCSGLGGENLTSQSKIAKLVEWYSGPCLLDVIDNFQSPERSAERPFRCSVSDVYKGVGAGFTIAGKVFCGYIQVSDQVLVMPAAVIGQVKAISIHDEVRQWAAAGDHVSLTVIDIDMTDLTIGSVLSAPSSPVKAATKFKAQIIVFNIDVPITRGFPVLIHYQSVNEPGIVNRLVHSLDRNSGEIIRKKPRCLGKNSSAVVLIEPQRPICVELYKDCKDLGRFMLRSRGSTIAAGVVIEIFS
ncbi:HBS1-like protein [Oscarella lobularis]|uniref:HBS1-like protein n=1 Tax=Oscarella lobularis TaxID=121494 RepID=UPI003314001E